MERRLLKLICNINKYKYSLEKICSNGNIYNKCQADVALTLLRWMSIFKGSVRHC